MSPDDPTPPSDATPGGDAVSPGDVTRLLEAVRGGERDALDRLLPIVYDELRAVAGRQLGRERPDHTLHATALVHETYVKHPKLLILFSMEDSGLSPDGAFAVPLIGPCSPAKIKSARWEPCIRTVAY